MRELQAKEQDLDRERQKCRDLARENGDYQDRVADLEREVNRLQQDVVDYRQQVSKQKERAGHGRVGDAEHKAVLKVRVLLCIVLYMIEI